MKKIITIIICLLILTSCAFADEPQFADVNEMYEYWQLYGIPDYVCGVWKTDGADGITVAVKETDDDSAVLAKLEAMLDDSTGLTVTKGTRYKYYHYELEEIKNELVTKLKACCPDGDYSVVISEMGNYVYIDLTAAVYAETMDTALEISAPYGDVVMIAVAEKSAPFEDPVTFNGGFNTGKYEDVPADNVGSADIMTSGTEKDTDLELAWLMLAVLAMLVIGYTAYKRRTAVAQTNVGTVELNGVMSTKEIKEAIKSSAIEPSPELEEKIKSKIQ